MSEMENTKETPTNPEDRTVELLARGVMEIYEPPLTCLNTHLKELTSRQEGVHNMLTSVQRQLDDIQNDAMLDALLADIATNREMLAVLTTNMMNMHKRVKSLENRAIKIEKVAKAMSSQNKQPNN